MASLESIFATQLGYVAYYGRFADPDGLVFWATKRDQANGDISEFVDEFGNSAESAALFGEITADNIAETVNSFYQFLFGRDADAGGQQFYVDGFLAGTFTPSSIALDIANGAQGTDRIILDNKLTAANQATQAVAGQSYQVESPTGDLIPNPLFGSGDPVVTYAGDADAQAARDYISMVNENASSIPGATELDDFLVSIADEGDAIFPDPSGTLFDLTPTSVNGLPGVRITGDSEVEFSLTGNQTGLDAVVGLDLDGDGTIERNGIENNDPTAQDDGLVVAVVDAYRRDKLNEGNTDANYLGDIVVDGTGFNADGVDSDGTILLGGFGADLLIGGIGNDALIGGGVAQGNFGTDTLRGGRNADILAVSTEGPFPDDIPGFIDGGSTFDDNPAQDNDWLIFEGQDDAEPHFINLTTGFINNPNPTSFELANPAMINIENVNASGQAFGFFDAVDVSLGENGQRTADGENVFIGSTGQLVITGDEGGNILIGGADNDEISGMGGNDLIFGGLLPYAQNNPNTPDIINDGRDRLFGGEGNDNIVLEFDGGVADGGEDDDTFHLTSLSTGAETVEETTDDGTVRIDLEMWTGYGGADVMGTQDQSNWSGSDSRLTLTNGENVIASGLGPIDYLVAGTNMPDASFDNQQNFDAIDGDLDLRGTERVEDEGDVIDTGNNVLYAAGGDDTIEGRGGDDLLSGGDGLDDFIFADDDGFDVIHRQIDADGDGIQDVDADGNAVFGQDFGTLRSVGDGTTTLFITFPDTVDLTNPNVNVTQFEVTIDGVLYGEDISTADLVGLETTAELAAAFAAAFPAETGITVEAINDDTVSIVVPDDDAVIETTVANGTVISGNAIGAPFQADLSVDVLDDTIEQDTLTFASYQNRATGELVDDDGTANLNDGDESLGGNDYAEDYVAHYGPEGTSLANEQSFDLVFGVEDSGFGPDEFDASFSTEDIVTVTVNGVAYSVQRGVADDGTAIDGESADEALERLADKMNDNDQHSFAGDLSVFYDDGDDTLSIGQDSGGISGEDVFMDTPVVAFTNLSGGAAPTPAVIENTSDNQIFLMGFDGLNGNLNAENVRFVGNSGISRAVFATALDEGGELSGSDAVAFFDLGDPDEVLNRTRHGDDSLKSGLGDDVVLGLTGDDRVFGSLGDDELDGGKDHYLDSDGGLLVLNKFEADDRNADADPSNDVDFLTDYQDQAIFDGRDFGPGVGFTATVDAGLITMPTDPDVLSDGFKVTVTNSLNGDTTVATNFEGIRTINGDGGPEGLDTIDLMAVSDASVADADGTAAGDDDAGFFFNLEDGTIEVDVADGAGGTDFFGDFGEALGFENVMGGDGSDEVEMGDSDVLKSNVIDLGGEVADGDMVTYDVDDNPGVDVDVVIEAEENTDTVTVDGPILDGPVTDTLIDVEMISFTDDLLDGDSDSLDLSNVEDAIFSLDAGEVNFGESLSGVAVADEPDDADNLVNNGLSSFAAPGEEIAVIGGADRFEEFLFGSGGDLLVVADESDLDGDEYVADMGAGDDTIDFRANDDQLEVFVEAGSDRVELEDFGGVKTIMVSGNETYYGGSDLNTINMSEAPADTTIEYSAEEEVVDVLGVDPAGATGTYFRTEVRNTAAPMDVLANFINTGAEDWLTVVGGALAETVIVTDNETADAHDFVLGGGANVVDASAVTTQTDAVIESFAATGDTTHDFNGDEVTTSADSLTLIASLDSTTDLIDATDTFNEEGAGSQVVIDLAAGTLEEFDDEGTSLNAIGVQNFEDVTTGGSDDTITGNTAINVINVGAGEDTVNGGGGDDDIDGTTGDKDFSGGAGNDTIDVLSATGDESVLNGDAGDDILTGGDGVQLFFGGADTDTINMGDADASVDRLTYDAENASDSQGATADTVNGFATGEDQVWILTDDASNLSGVATLLGGATTIAVDLGDDLALGGLGANADELVDVNDGGVIADGDVVLRIDQSAGGDLQSLATPHIAHIVYDAASDSQLGGRDEFDEFDLGSDLFDVEGLGLTATDYDVAPDGLQLDEVLKVAIPVSVDNASSLPGFFAADPAQNADADAAGESVLFVLQNEQGTPNYRFFVDVNQDGDFNAADDMVFDITNEPDGAPANVAAILASLGGAGASVDDLFLGVGVA